MNLFVNNSKRKGINSYHTLAIIGIRPIILLVFYVNKSVNIMNRNLLVLIIGALIVLLIGFSYYTYQQESKTSRIELKIDK
ncbi:hypothetical protein [Bartonella taylorii]|uniref:hypothetical protein n=1 Tax=Bartonella taylorii TaxID=33046 RepID=UPI001ABB8389|nr:hypothetical protein [Bartonella taylorii]